MAAIAIDCASMNMHSIIVGDFAVNCFVLWGELHQAIIVDPGAQAGEIVELLQKNRLTPAAYLCTHAHMDHIGALADLHRQFPAPIGMAQADLHWAFSQTNQVPPHYGVPKRPSEISRILADGDTYTDGGLTYRVLSTPGHSPGAVCFYFEHEGILLSGDTLFEGSVGRTDLPGGSATILQKSLLKLAALPDATRVFPGHGADTTLQHEKATNYFMQRSAT
jgi:glyoxylase-like metal-dependent hydrolase (beta-lactamase superfamily II)